MYDPTLAALNLESTPKLLVSLFAACLQTFYLQMYAAVVRQASREPPLNVKCKHKFLIQSTVVTPENENMSPHEIVRIIFYGCRVQRTSTNVTFLQCNNFDVNEGGIMHQQRIRVTYLSALVPTLEQHEANTAVIIDRTPSVCSKQCVVLRLTPHVHLAA